jgi:hypothetical protein
VTWCHEIVQIVNFASFFEISYEKKDVRTFEIAQECNVDCALQVMPNVKG